MKVSAMAVLLLLWTTNFHCSYLTVTIQLSLVTKLRLNMEAGKTAQRRYMNSLNRRRPVQISKMVLIAKSEQKNVNYSQGSVNVYDFWQY